MDNSQVSVLLVDDEPQFLSTASLALRMAGFKEIQTCEDSQSALDVFRSRAFDLVSLDITMPGMDGKTLLKKMRAERPEASIIMISGLNEVDQAVECIKAGAFDYVVKPVSQERLVTSIRRAIEHQAYRFESQAIKNAFFSQKLQHAELFSEIVTNDPHLLKTFIYIEAIGASPLPVLIRGETGVGKQKYAETIHKVSGLPGKFVCLNVAGIDDAMFSDTLFGHVRGAFTGADTPRRGLIEQAEGGTLFLDEIGDLAMESQVKLLHLLDEGQYYPVGSDIPKMARTRVVAATNRDLEKMQADGKFRRDLFYRLQSHQIRIPPLRERLGDLPLLVEHFISQGAEQLHKVKPAAPPELHVLLSNYAFPGNVRELQGMVLDALTQHGAGGTLSLNVFKEKIQNSPQRQLTPAQEVHGDIKVRFSLQLPSLAEVENALIQEALRRTNGNKSLAAQLMGITRQTLNNKLKQEA